MGVWRHRDDGQVECLLHASVFPPGHECSECVTDPPPGDNSADVEPVYTYYLARHEQAFEALAVQAKEFAEAVADGSRSLVSNRSEPMMVVAKLMEVSIKARRAAVELCAKREAQQRVEGLELRLRQFHDRAEGRQGAH